MWIILSILAFIVFAGIAKSRRDWQAQQALIDLRIETLARRKAGM